MKEKEGEKKVTCVGAKKQNNAADCVVSHPGHARLPYRALEVTRQRSHHGPSRMLSAACTSNPGAPRRTRARASPQFCHVLIAIMHHNLPHGETFLGSYVSRCLIPSTRRPSPSNKIFLSFFFPAFLTFYNSFDMADSTENQREEWEVADGVPNFTDPFIQKYMSGRDALVQQEKKQRSGR